MLKGSDNLIRRDVEKSASSGYDEGAMKAVSVFCVGPPAETGGYCMSECSDKRFAIFPLALAIWSLKRKSAETCLSNALLLSCGHIHCQRRLAGYVWAHSGFGPICFQSSHSITWPSRTNKLFIILTIWGNTFVRNTLATLLFLPSFIRIFTFYCTPFDNFDNQLRPLSLSAVFRRIYQVLSGLSPWPAFGKLLIHHLFIIQNPKDLLEMTTESFFWMKTCQKTISTRSKRIFENTSPLYDQSWMGRIRRAKE